MRLHENCINIGENVPVEFEGVYFRRGYKNKKEWRALMFRFKDGDLVFNHMLFEPVYGDYLQNREFGSVLREVLDTLSRKKLWDTIPKYKNSWNDFYEYYIKLIKPYRGSMCYIKTLAEPHWEKKEFCQPVLAKENFISLTDDMSYTILEENIVSNYLDTEDLYAKPIGKADNKEIIF